MAKVDTQHYQKLENIIEGKKAKTRIFLQLGRDPKRVREAKGNN